MHFGQKRNPVTLVPMTAGLKKSVYLLIQLFTLTDKTATSGLHSIHTNPNKLPASEVN